MICLIYFFFFGVILDTSPSPANAGIVCKARFFILAKRTGQATAYMLATVFSVNFSTEIEEDKFSRVYAYLCGKVERK